MGGTQNFRSQMGGGNLRKNPTEAKTAYLMQNKAIFCYCKHEIQLFKVLLSLKVVKFDTKMNLNFSNFRGRTSAGGGQALVQNRAHVSDGGGDWQNFCRMEGPPVPLKKKKPWKKACHIFKTKTNKNKKKIKQTMNIHFINIKLAHYSTTV